MRSESRRLTALAADRHFNEVSVFGYRGAVGFDGLANLFAGDACSLLNEVLVESQELLRSLVFKDTAKISKAYHQKRLIPMNE